MGLEIFGPVLPILTYKTDEEMLEIVNSRPKPLALYLFTSNKKLEKTVLSRCSFGGGCINDAKPYTGFKEFLLRMFLK